MQRLQYVYTILSEFKTYCCNQPELQTMFNNQFLFHFGMSSVATLLFVLLQVLFVNVRYVC